MREWRDEGTAERGYDWNDTSSDLFNNLIFVVGLTSPSSKMVMTRGALTYILDAALRLYT
jgi:hypothetical protein